MSHFMDLHKTLSTGWSGSLSWGVGGEKAMVTKSWHRPVSTPLSEDLEHTKSSSETDISNFDDAQHRPLRFLFRP